MASLGRAAAVCVAVGTVGCAIAWSVESDKRESDRENVVVIPSAGLRQASALQGGDGVTALTTAAATPVYTQIGTVTPRSAAALKASGIESPFSIGAETTDRGYSIFANWRDYLGPLGFPKARVQVGWADVERSAGVYDFSKLNGIVDGMKAQGVNPWLQLSYGNPVYADGGDATSASPVTAAGTPGRTAWINFVKATVATYNTSARKVTEWEIWNEPDLPLSGTSTPRVPVNMFGEFAVATAKAIKDVQPEAKILIGGFASLQYGTGSTYPMTVVKYFSQNKGPTIPSSDVQITYHVYQSNPDTSYGTQFQLSKDFIESVGFKVRQGESGAPSAFQPQFALSNTTWTENSQAKYDLRRLLNDFYRKIDSNLFTITDLHYASSKNTKGLLLTGAWSSTPPTYGDQTVKRPKVAYRAAQNVAAIFDNRLERLTSPGCTAPTGYTVQAYSRLDPNNIRRNMLVVWRNTDRPGVNETVEYISITCTNFQFPRYKTAGFFPRYTDLMTGGVFAPSTGVTVTHSGASSVTISGLRAYDGPVILSDQGIVLFTA